MFVSWLNRQLCMCLVLYIGSDTPLPGIPEVFPPESLHVREIDVTEAAVRQHFSKPYVYFAGAHTGCSCGFEFGPNAENSAQGFDSVQRLRAYLSAALDLSSCIELYACWDGDEGEVALSHETIGLDWLSGNAGEFELSARWLGTLVRIASDPGCC